MGEGRLVRAEKLKAGKVDVDVPLVERLVAAQFPQWAGLPVQPVADDGWDNWTFHLGDRMKVRLPSAAGYVPQVEKESLWLPRLAPQLPVPIPLPLGIGTPGEGYPFPWAVYGWIDGQPASHRSLGTSSMFATDVAAFLRALKAIDATGGPAAGPQTFFRGASLAAYNDEARRSIAALAGRIDTAAALRVWDAALGARWSGPAVWLHGDVAAGNLLRSDGRLCAVIDFGGLAVGDPACDLVLAWPVLEGDARQAFRAAAPGDAAMWARARGWALWKNTLMLAAGRDANPLERGFEAVIADIVAE